MDLRGKLESASDEFILRDGASNQTTLKVNASSTNQVTLTLPPTAASDVLLGAASTQTLTNKTLTGNIAVTLVSGAATITLPTATGTLATLGGTETLTAKTLTSPAINTPTIAGGTITGATIVGATTVGLNDTDSAFSLDIASTSTLTANRVLTLDVTDSDSTVRLTGDLSLAGGFATSGAFNLILTATGATNVTLPTTGTLSTLAGAETLTNKTLTSPKLNENVAVTTTATKLNYLTSATGTTGTASTNIVFSTSPTLVTPALGTPTALVLTNATGLPLAAGVTGQLPIANGGTGQATANTALNALLPSQATHAAKALVTDGTDTSWSAVATDALNQYNVKVGDSTNTAAAVNTNLLGDIKGNVGSGTFTITIAAPGVVTKTSHGLVTGDKVYLTTTGALPTGLVASTAYWVVLVDANTFSLASSLANAKAGTKITTTGSQSGTHTISHGGLVLTSGTKGTLTNDSATAGYVGERLTASGTVGTVALDPTISTIAGPITLTPGDWDVSFVAWCATGGGSQAGVNVGLNYTAASRAQWSLGETQVAANATGTASGSGTSVSLPAWQILVAAGTTQTVYLTASAVSQGNTVTGRISARRMR